MWRPQRRTAEQDKQRRHRVPGLLLGRNTKDQSQALGQPGKPINSSFFILIPYGQWSPSQTSSFNWITLKLSLALKAVKRRMRKSIMATTVPQLVIIKYQKILLSMVCLPPNLIHNSHGLCHLCTRKQFSRFKPIISLFVVIITPSHHHVRSHH